MRRINHSSRFIEMQRTSDYQNELGDFIERCVPERCGDRELPVLSVTKEYAMVHQSERFEATVVSRDKSNYIVAPRGYLVQGIHIDESNFGIQNLVDEGIVSPAYKLWRFKNQDCIPELIEYYLRSEMAIKYFKRHFLGSTVPRRQVIKKDDFLSMPLNLPEKRIQERYFAFFQQADKSKFSNFKSRFIEMQRTSDYQNELGDFIERCVPERCGDRELPVLSVTKEYAMVHQSERFEATVVSRDKSNYIVAPRGYLVQGIHIDESNFGIQNLVDEGIVSPAYKLWRFKNQDCIPELIEYYLRSEMAIKYFKRHFLGSTVPRRQVIKKDDFLSMPLNLPEKRIQERYFAFFQQADKSKYLN